MNQRINKLYSKLEKKNLDGFIVSLPANISYLTEYISRDSYLLVSKKENIYFTDSRYIEEAKLALDGIAAIKKSNGSIFKLIADACLAQGLSRIGFEERNLPFAEYKKIQDGLSSGAVLEPTHSYIEELRQIKESLEVQKIREAIAITARAFKFIKKFIRPGMSELKIAGELERFIRYAGATGASFNTIVGSGPNSSFPHHLVSDRLIKKGELVLIDMGVEFQGYKSDLTRVVLLDKMNVHVQRVYAIVLQAQNRAIKAIKPGTKIAEIDEVSRKFISDVGYGEFFGHALGHGVGLEVHEDPHISGQSPDTLQEGMVFTVEPAIYLPGKFGIRIEDMVLVTSKGCEVLSGAVNK